jgi:hypothetical protein
VTGLFCGSQMQVIDHQATIEALRWLAR